MVHLCCLHQNFLLNGFNLRFGFLNAAFFAEKPVCLNMLRRVISYLSHVYVTRLCTEVFSEEHAEYACADNEHVPVRRVLSSRIYRIIFPIRSRVDGSREQITL